jgi:glucuronate isomerase
MIEFMDKHFLLKNETARKLYHQYARDMPVFDYHCHLNPREIADNQKYENITQLWLKGDHYKWRAMRSNGVAEEYITGEADDKDKFFKWAETLENAIGNPIFHWAHLELRRYFGVKKVLNRKSADEIWRHCNSMLQDEGFTARGFIEKSNVNVICTTDDPVDPLDYHQTLIRDDTFKTKMLPAFRPDKGINIDQKGFRAWLAFLEQRTDREIKTFSSLTAALEERIRFFHENGCRISDHALEPPVFERADETDLERIFKKRLEGGMLNASEVKKHKTETILFLCRQYAKRGWAQQFHIGTLRNANGRMYRKLGPDTGFDTIGDASCIENLVNMLNDLDGSDELARTILYNINPRDNEALGALIGCYQGGGIAGKMQLGSAWWFNDHKDGMTRQLTALSNLGLLGCFVGMLTDSRSILSYTRHEYFRRILCAMIGEWVEAGEAPRDEAYLGQIVQNICYNNACRYFGINGDNQV